MFNVVVERIFSFASAVKTKARNQMQLKLLDSIIRIRAELLLSNKCCKDFTPSTAMLENLTSDKVYSDGHDIDDADMELFYTNWNTKYIYLLIHIIFNNGKIKSIMSKLLSDKML